MSISKSEEMVITGRHMNFNSILRPIIEISADNSDASNNMTPNKAQYNKNCHQKWLSGAEKISSDDIVSL